MPAYRRPLSVVIDNVAASGFRLVRLLEPRPTEQFRRVDPVRYERLLRQPSFLCIEAERCA